MQSRYLVVVAAIALAATSDDRTLTTPTAASFSKGVSEPTVALNLAASYSTTAPMFYSDGRAVQGAPSGVGLEPTGSLR